MRRSLIGGDRRGAPDSAPDSAPAWTVSYGDMMSLLLTLFVMLISMSEIKHNDKFQGVADSLHEQFSLNSAAQGGLVDGVRPRNAALAVLAVAGRQTRQAVMMAGEKRHSGRTPLASFRLVSNERTALGGSVEFDHASAELSAAAKAQLRELAKSLADKPQLIEIRAQARQSPAQSAADATDGLDLAWRQARSTGHELVDDLGIEPRRLRISVTARSAAAATAGPTSATEKSMVEVFLLEETPPRE